MVDCKDGLTNLDLDFSKIIRVLNKKTIIVANKADNYKITLNSNEFQEVIAIAYRSCGTRRPGRVPQL